MDHAGNVMLNTKYKNTRDDAEKFATMALSKYKDCSAVCESTARMWIKTYETFEKHSIPIKLANTLRLRLSQSGPKTDKIDAKKLANRLRMNDIPECYVHTPENRRVLDILRDRVATVKERTRILNRQHSILDKYDYKIMANNGDTSSEKHQNYLGTLTLDSNDTRAIMFTIRHVLYLNKEIETLEKLIEEAAYKNEYAKLIMSIPGFGAFSALYVAVSIDKIERFDSPKKLVSFMGLCPRVYQSGDSTVYGHMKKDVDHTLKWVMMNSTMVGIRHDDWLNALYSKHEKRHVKLVARSHVAKKVATYIYYMLTRNEEYRYCVEEKYKKKLARLKPK